MQLVLHIEKEFQLKVANDDLDYENFKSINAITDFIGQKDFK
jgi:methoxymalonate biosynthesis acyl carrier protein